MGKGEIFCMMNSSNAFFVHDALIITFLQRLLTLCWLSVHYFSTCFSLLCCSVCRWSVTICCFFPVSFSYNVSQIPASYYVYKNFTFCYEVSQHLSVYCSSVCCCFSECFFVNCISILLFLLSISLNMCIHFCLSIRCFSVCYLSLYRLSINISLHLLLKFGDYESAQLSIM